MNFSIRNIAVGVIAGTTIVVGMKLVGMYVNVPVSGPAMLIAGAAIAWVLIKALKGRVT